jgi:alginate O-acetyltransferase complex protein AlgI
MSFVSFSFLVLFLLVFLGRLLAVRKKAWGAYLFLLLAASLFFYASFVPSYLLILFFTTGVDFYMARKIDEAGSARIRRSFLMVSLSANLGMLAYFKYAGFFTGVLRNVAGFGGASKFSLNLPEMVLPIGISFFTFESMSYTIDVYRGHLKPIREYWKFLLFVSFFTHMVSGPIVRAKELLYQFKRKRKPRLKVCLEGAYLMTSGFFFKMVVADNLASYVNKYWERGAMLGMPASVPWALAILFAGQIFSDFCGYSLIASGAAYLLGFKLPCNFNSPFIASTFREFWGRWHITLSRWIRDYLYIPLGGNEGSGPRVFVVLMLTMILAGFWHGAAYTFLAWGAIHGLALAIERWAGFNRGLGTPSFVWRVLWSMVVQGVVLMAWIFFRSEDLGQAKAFLSNMTCRNLGLDLLGGIAPAFLLLIPIFLTHARTWMEEREIVGRAGGIEKAFYCALMFYCILTMYGENNAFIYFQF